MSACASTGAPHGDNGPTRAPPRCPLKTYGRLTRPKVAWCASKRCIFFGFAGGHANALSQRERESYPADTRRFSAGGQVATGSAPAVADEGSLVSSRCARRGLGVGSPVSTPRPHQILTRLWKQRRRPGRSEGQHPAAAAIPTAAAAAASAISAGRSSRSFRRCRQSGRRVAPGCAWRGDGCPASRRCAGCWPRPPKRPSAQAPEGRASTRAP